MTAVLFCSFALLFGCSDDPGQSGGDLDAGATDDVASSEDTSDDDASDGEEDAGDDEDAGTDDADTDDAGEPDTGPDGPDPFLFTTCHDDPPDGAELAPDPKPFSSGDCPELVDGMNMLEIEDDDALPLIGDDVIEREFMLVVPDDLEDDEQLPVVFLWHWLGGDAERFYERGEIRDAVDTQRFLAVIPEEKGDLQFRWPYSREVELTPERIDEELEFFDDMLACVAEQYDVNHNCVASAGVSAGALWTVQLVGHRSEYLSSFLSLSGGVGEEPDGIFDPEAILPWTSPEKAVPGIVLWGGPEDWCIVDFHEASLKLEEELIDDDHFFVECIHNCAHAKPPLEADDDLSRFAAMWQFVIDHPYWITPGASAYEENGLPDMVPDWCGIGPGSAQMREGECPPHSCQ